MSAHDRSGRSGAGRGHDGGGARGSSIAPGKTSRTDGLRRRGATRATIASNLAWARRTHEAAVAKIPAAKASVDPAGAREMHGARQAIGALRNDLAMARSRLDDVRADAAEVAPELLGEITGLLSAIAATSADVQPILALSPPSYVAPADRDAELFGDDPDAAARIADAELREERDWNGALDGAAAEQEGFTAADGADGAAHDDADSATGEVPHRGQMEALFGESFGDVSARTGAGAEMSALGARAAASGDEIAFADSNPDPATVAHELTHVVQQRQAGTQSMAADAIVPSGEPAEVEARTIADGVRSGTGPSRVEVHAQPGDGLHLDQDAPPNAAGADAKPPTFAAESSVRSQLGQLVPPNDAARLRRRRDGLANLFADLPGPDRAILLRRLESPVANDDLPGRFAGIEASTREALLQVLRTGAVTYLSPFDPIEVLAFLETVESPRFVIAPADPVIDGAWVKDVEVTVHVNPGFGPPQNANDVQLVWSVLDRTGTAVEWAPRATMPWPAVGPNTAPFSLTIPEAGRYHVQVEVLIAGGVRKRVLAPVEVRKVSGDESAGLAATLGPGEQSAAARDMDDEQLREQAKNLQDRLATYRDKPGPELAKDKEYKRLREAYSELEFQAAQRTDNGQPLDLGTPTSSVLASATAPIDSWDGMGLQMESREVAEARVPDMVATADRGQIRMEVEALVAEHGFLGARIELMSRANQSPFFGGQGDAAWAPFLEELDSLKAELDGFTGYFSDVAFSIANGMLDQSEQQIQGELERYGYRAEEGPLGMPMYERDPNAGGQEELDQLGDVVRSLAGMKRQIDELVPVAMFSEAAAEQLDAAQADYETQLVFSLQAHPALQALMDGGIAAMTFSFLDKASNAEIESAMVHQLTGKLVDIEKARTKIAKDKVSPLAIPSVVEMTKRQLRVLPDTPKAALVDSAVANAGDGDWWESARNFFTISLAVLLLVPSGGTSAGLAFAAEATLLVADLAALGDLVGRSDTASTMKNTALDQALALAIEEPSASELLLSIAMVPSSVRGAVGALNHARIAVQKTRALRAALREARDAVGDPRVAELSSDLQAFAERFMGKDKADEWIAAIRRGEGAGARGGIDLAIERGGTITETSAAALGQRMNVPVEVASSADRVQGVVDAHISKARGRLNVDKLVASPNATEQQVLDHAVTVDAVRRYNDRLDEIRHTVDEVTEIRQGAIAPNPHDFDTNPAAFRGFEEVRKYENAIQTRMDQVAAQIGKGGPAAADTVARLEDELLHLEGEWRYWQDVLDRTRKNPGLELDPNVISASGPTETTIEAVGKGYEEPPPGCFYRRWPNPDKDAAQYQLVRGKEAPPGQQALTPVREGDGFALKPSESAGKVPHLYDNAQQSGHDVFLDLMQRSPSLAQYKVMMSKLEVLRNLPAGHYERRMELIVMGERKASRDAGGALAGQVDEDTLRHAIKDELRGDVLAYLDELSDAASYQELRRFTDDLNSSDLGNICEDWYARRHARGGQQHVRASKEELAAGNPPIEIERDRFIDNLMPDGTAVEVKSITGKLSDRETTQLDDYLDMAENQAAVGAGKQQVRRVKYVFTRPEGLRANLARVEELLRDATKPFSCDVFLSNGTLKSINNLDELNAVRSLL